MKNKDYDKLTDDQKADLLKRIEQMKKNAPALTDSEKLAVERSHAFLDKFCHRR